MTRYWPAGNNPRTADEFKANVLPIKAGTATKRDDGAGQQGNIQLDLFVKSDGTIEAKGPDGMKVVVH